MKNLLFGPALASLPLVSLLQPAGCLALAYAGDKIIPPDQSSGVIVLILFYLLAALAFSLALEPLFRWRWFIKKCHGKGLKTPIILLAALVTSWGLNLDFIGHFLRIMDPDRSGSNIPAIFFSGLLLAGGSGIFHGIIQKISGGSYMKRVGEVLGGPGKTAGTEALNAAPRNITRLTYSKSQQRLTGSGGSWSARNSAPDHPPIKNGLYAVVPRSLVIGTEDDPIVPRKKLYAEPPFLDSNGLGWFLVLFRIDPNTGQLMEEDAGIHPLGQENGALGCIGITEQDTRPLFNFLKSRYFQTYNIEVTN